MNRTIVWREAAARDLAEPAVYLAERSPAAAHRFLDAVQQASAFLAAMPEAGSPCEFRSPAAHGLRAWLVRGFEKHVLFYRHTESTIDVVRVLHGSRDLEAIFEQASS